MSNFLGDSQLARIVLGHQVNAVSWAIAMLCRSRSVTFDDVTRALADSETRAQFRCGFVGLEADADYKKGLKQYLTDEGYITVGKDDYVSLTAKGSTAAENDDNKRLAQYLHLS